MEMITFLKRRFSSGDLQGEADEHGNPIPPQSQVGGVPNYGAPRYGAPGSAAGGMNSNSTGYAPPGQTGMGTGMQQSMGQQNPYQQPATAAPMGRAYPSAPTSPTKSFVSNPMGSITGQISNSITRGIFSSSKPAINKDRCKTLLVIDDPQTDWSKYFRGRKVFGDYDIRVEQATFNELSLAVSPDMGCLVDMKGDRSGTKVVKSLCPDFVLIRQHPNDVGEDWRNIIVGFMFGGVPALNTIPAVYNMLDRPWVFSHLVMIRNRLGRENFPLIDQVYYPNHQEMINAGCKEKNRNENFMDMFRQSQGSDITTPATNYPLVLKVGHGHAGLGKIKVDNPSDFQDVAGVVAVATKFATTEPFVDAKYDLHLQKIGASYRAFVRKSISGTWKANTGSAMLEQIPITDRFRAWVDEVARIFGGLDVCSVEAIQSKTGEFVIFEVNGSDMTLLGETQEDDRRQIAELVMQKMQMVNRNNLTKTASLQGMGQDGHAMTNNSMTSSSVPPTPLRSGQSHAPPPMTNQTRPPPLSSASGMSMGDSMTSQSNTMTSMGGAGGMMRGAPVSTVGSTAMPSSGMASSGVGSGMTGVSAGKMGVGNSSTPSMTSMGMSSGTGLPSRPPPVPPLSANMSGGMSGMQGTTPGLTGSSMPPPPPRPLTSTPSSGSINSGPSVPGGIPGRPAQGPARQGSRQNSTSGDDGEDTMKNLRKTFAGIFGDM